MRKTMLKTTATRAARLSASGRTLTQCLLDSCRQKSLGGKGGGGGLHTPHVVCMHNHIIMKSWLHG